MVPETTTFSKGGVESLRAAYFAYLKEVSSILVQHDKITKKEEKLVETACSLNEIPELTALVQLAKSQAAAEATAETSHKPAKKRMKKNKITAEMQAEQEKLLNQSRIAMVKKRTTT